MREGKVKEEKEERGKRGEKGENGEVKGQSKGRGRKVRGIGDWRRGWRGGRKKEEMGKGVEKKEKEQELRRRERKK